ncbi:MAG: hypothetical protein M3N82_02410 [Pseudomonadota bacterium]|nr:hypothetical protein [Pseudomonadota bacterium]
MIPSSLRYIVAGVSAPGAIVVLALASAALITGCGGGGDASTSTTSSTTSDSSSSSGTPLRAANAQDVVSPLYPSCDFVWFSAQDPNGAAKLLITWQTASSQMPSIAINVTKPNGSYANLSTVVSAPVVRTGLPSISAEPVDSSADRIDFRWVPSESAYHLTFTAAGMSGNLWFRNNQVGAAMQPVQWDQQQVFWSSSIGRTDIDGSIQFVGDAQATTVTGWQGEEERMAGSFSLDPGHVGYEYAQTSNPDGSADQLFVFPQISGGNWRGLLAHVEKSGELTYCEPDVVQLANYQKTAEGYVYPGTVHAKCTARNLDLTYTVSTPQDFPLGPPGLATNSYPAYTSMSAGSSNVTGSVGTIQHLRDLGYYGS